MSNQTEPIKVSKIEINIRGKVLSLTLAEMQELKDVLDKMFPTRVEYVPYQWPSIWQHTTTEPTLNPPWKHWEVTCESIGDNSGVMCLAAK